MLLQVHDELVIECPRNEMRAVAGVVRDVMENAYPMGIPLTTEARWGMNWDELQPLA
jgi:DNA polymerase-1